ncbi:hypothetical protein [Amycolatopsis jiangsuensis]|uniref:Uncharacterized protein n=1 Tax=Amycolatopsis jiangsuensis TaxID=1181879 RepID=A0A840J1R1_9PSEU|nr:hypothetical protein [Amycolatopsis jiangsuensis]MBB4687689.1 hypothetical protein [Amycolatopsis jiangsuensis]
MEIHFRHDPRGESYTRIRRVDGVVLGLPSYSRKWRVPHDLAHAVAERELGWGGGVFGCIAAGGVFDNMVVLRGKTRHDARVRSQRVFRSAKRSIGVAECLSGVLHHAVEHRLGTPLAEAREAWGVLREDSFPWQDSEIRDATDRLRELAGVWSGGADLDFHWPERLRPA